MKIKQCVGNAEPFSDMILGVGETWDLFDSSEETIAVFGLECYSAIAL